MEMASAIILGIIQGITEWLPVSSSAHLALANHFLGLGASVEFQVALNLGTLISLIVYMRNEIWQICKGVLSCEKKSMRLLYLIILAGIPTAIIGFAGKAFFEGMFSDVKLVSFALIITGILLLLTKFVKRKEGKISEPSAIAQGIAQGFAVAPGISRSGSTISAALLLGVSPKEAAKFSFLIGLPAFLIASLIEIRQASPLNADFSIFAVGIIISAVVGYLSIHALMRVLQEGKFHYFSYYCIALGLIAFILSTFSFP